MQIAVVEDEIIWQQAIESKLIEYFDENIEIKNYKSGEQFLEDNKFYEIIFMDVEMKEKDGFATSMEYKKSHPDSIIIILTTHNEFCNRGYQVDAFRYLDKLKLKEMQEALDSALKKLGGNKKITLSVILTGEITIAFKDILYFETEGRNIRVHTWKESFECRENITELADKLKENGFYYVHRSYLINMDYVKTFSRNNITMSNGDSVLVSLRKLADFKKRFSLWKFERA